MSSDPPPQTTLITPQPAHALAYGNLLRVFSERDATKRQSAIPTIYTPSVTIYESGSISFTGHAATNETCSKLLAEREGWDFVPTGSVKLNHDLVYLAWGFGPRTSGEFGSGEKEG